VKYNYKPALLGALLSVAPVSNALSTPLPFDINAGKRVVSNFPSGTTLMDGLAPFCKKRKIEGDLCTMGYAATLTAKAMSKAGYSAKDTVALIARNGHVAFNAYDRLGMGEMLIPFVSLITIDGGPEYLVKYGMAAKKDTEALAKLYDKENQKKQLRSMGSNKPKAIDKSCVQKMIPHFRKQAGAQSNYMAEDIFAVQAENWCLKNG
jgi:hypothetical protein